MPPATTPYALRAFFKVICLTQLLVWPTAVQAVTAKKIDLTAGTPAYGKLAT